MSPRVALEVSSARLHGETAEPRVWPGYLLGGLGAGALLAAVLGLASLREVLRRLDRRVRDLEVRAELVEGARAELAADLAAHRMLLETWIDSTSRPGWR